MNFSGLLQILNDALLLLTIVRVVTKQGCTCPGGRKSGEGANVLPYIDFLI